MIGGPDGVEIGGLAPGRAYKSGLGPIGVRRAGRREQPDVRALRVDRLAIVLENNIVDPAALEVDRSADARRVDGHARTCRQSRADRLRRVRRRSARRGRSSRGRRARRRRRGAWLRLRRRLRAIRLHLGLHLRLVLVLIQRAGVEILPGGHHQDRQRDREKKVPGVLGIHVGLSLPFGALAADPRPRPSAPRRRAARKALRTSSTSAAKRRPSASRRAIST